MDVARWFFAVVALFWMLVGNFGCAGPQYAGVPSKANNEVTLERTSCGGVKARATAGADTKASVKGVEFSGANGTHGKVDSIDFEQQPSTTIGSWVGPMQVYDKQIQSTYAGITAWSDSFWTGLSKETQAIAPIATQFLGGMNAVNLAKAQRQPLVSQLAGLVGNGQVGLSQVAANDPSIAAAVESYLKSHLPASQPSQ